MVPAWAILIYILILAVILAGLWWLWRIEGRIWFISRDVIAAEADNLAKAHGAHACRIATRNELAAWQNADPYEAGKWSRVRDHLRRLEKNQSQ